MHARITPRHGVPAGHATRQPGFPELVGLVRSGKAYAKISGAYRASKLAPDYADVVLLAKALIAANPDRVVWGTDWPHPSGGVPGRSPTEVTPLLQIDDGRLLNQLPVWAPDAAIRKKILVDNPASLYGFLKSGESMQPDCRLQARRPGSAGDGAARSASGGAPWRFTICSPVRRSEDEATCLSSSAR